MGHCLRVSNISNKWAGAHTCSTYRSLPRKDQSSHILAESLLDKGSNEGSNFSEFLRGQGDGHIMGVKMQAQQLEDLRWGVGLVFCLLDS